MEIGPKAKRLAFIALGGLIFAHSQEHLRAQAIPYKSCHRPPVRSTVPEPEDLRSRNGELTVDLSIHNYIETDGSLRYCYSDAEGRESPNLRLSPGDLLILNLKNDMA